jgi:hypothetical protein
LKRLCQLVLIVGFVIPQIASAQLGGQRAFEFLNIPANARLAALGGVNITSGRNDPGMITSNPALLHSKWANKLAINRLGYFADINQTSLNYARNFEKAGVWALNLSYLDYGKIESRDENGFLNGEFSAAEYSFGISHSLIFGPFQAGATIKIAVSDLAGFNASALLFDLGGIFKHPEKDLTVGLAVKNLGLIVSDYTEINNSQLPLDIQVGASFKPEFMPFRFSLTARNLTRDDVVFFDPAANMLLGSDSKTGVGEEIFRRLVIGTELLLSDNFQLRVGYNHLLRQELKQEAPSGGAGFSFGFMFHVKRFEFSYARALYHAAGGSNTIQLVTDLSGITKKKN